MRDENRLSVCQAIGSFLAAARLELVYNEPDLRRYMASASR